MSGGVSLVLLAAGGGTRFGGGKLLADYGGAPLIGATLDGLSRAPVGERIVVLGDAADRVREACEPHNVRLVENSRWREGMSTSVLAGLGACAPESQAAVVALADQPLVGSAAVERLVAVFEGGAPVAVATYGGRRRNPALFSREVWPALWSSLSGDEGARGFMQSHPGLVAEVPCDDVADPADVDTVEDLRRLARGSPKRP